MNGFGSNASGGSLKVDASKVGGLDLFDANMYYSNLSPDYSNLSPDYVEHNGKIWKYINPISTAGNVPATGSLYWEEVSAEEFAHVQNTDSGTNRDTWLMGNDQTAGTTRTIQPRGSALDLDLVFRIKGFGKYRFVDLPVPEGQESALIVEGNQKALQANLLIPISLGDSSNIELKNSLETAVWNSNQTNVPGEEGQEFFAIPYFYKWVRVNTVVRFAITDLFENAFAIEQNGKLAALQAAAWVFNINTTVTGEPGMICRDTAYFYYCTAPMEWVRLPLFEGAGLPLFLAKLNTSTTHTKASLNADYPTAEEGQLVQSNSEMAMALGGGEWIKWPITRLV